MIVELCSRTMNPDKHTSVLLEICILMMYWSGVRTKGLPERFTVKLGSLLTVLQSTVFSPVLKGMNLQSWRG